MVFEIVIGVAVGLIMLMFSIIMSDLRAVKVRQERQEEYRNCKMDAMDYAIEQIHDGEYVETRDKKFTQLLDSYNFIRKHNK